MVGIPELVPVFFAGEVVSILKSSDAAAANNGLDVKLLLAVKPCNASSYKL